MTIKKYTFLPTGYFDSDNNDTGVYVRLDDVIQAIHLVPYQGLTGLGKSDKAYIFLEDVFDALGVDNFRGEVSDD